MYINEIIRVTYKCNWSCKFCNVLKTNNYWWVDVSNKEVIFKILLLTKKYSIEQRKKLILSFSWGEPTLDKQLTKYIKLAKSIWVWNIQIQTNWTMLFKKLDLINELIESWLDDIFLAQHSNNDKINKYIWSYFNNNDFNNWINYIIDNKLYNKIQINFNIVLNKINIKTIIDYLQYLKEINFFELLRNEDNFWRLSTKRISFWLVQPNWYANINREVLLIFDKEEKNIISDVINFCEDNNIYPDFHYTSPPLCVLDLPDYNLEHHRLRDLKNDIDRNNVELSNLESFKFLWKEKQKYKECDKCLNNNYCLWFYKNWIKFIWEDEVKNIIKNYLNKNV